MKAKSKEFDDRLPSLEPLTDEALEKIDVEQNKRAKIMALGTSGSQLKLARESALVAQLSQIKDLEPDQKIRYAEALANTGEYDAAHKISKEPLYKEISKAIKGAKPCKCVDTTEVTLENGRPKTKIHSRLFTKRRIWVDGQEKNLICCSKCGRLTCNVEN